MRYTLPTLDGTKEADVARLDAWGRLYQTDEIRAVLDDIRDESSTVPEIVSGCSDDDCDCTVDLSSAQGINHAIRQGVEDIEYQLDLLDGVA